MSQNRRFQKFSAYLITDMKDGVFVDEPAIYVGRRDSDMKRPTICAVCGEPLGSKGYPSFYLTGPTGRGKDMMIGNGCIRDRIRAKEVDGSSTAFMDKWNRMIARFPNSGRWYGTFLHHCIAKPYVRNKNSSKDWDESVLSLPGVRYIMGIIDDLRDKGWNLDAELVLECGNVDLLATHPDGRTIVYDWKSDLSFENHAAYLDQVNRYMAELTRAGIRNVMGYIVWVREKRLEPVLFTGVLDENDEKADLSYVPSLPIKCSLTIDMDGGSGIRQKRMTEYSHHRIYGDEVTFYIDSRKLSKIGYDFRYFEASSYREGEPLQPFNSTDAENGLHVSFICSKKRHSFQMKANWKRIRPFECILLVKEYDGHFTNAFFVRADSQIDDEGGDYVEFDVSEINRRMGDKVLEHAKLFAEDVPEGVKTEWSSEELRDGMTLRIPCFGENSRFEIDVKTSAKPKKKKETPQSRKTEQRPIISSDHQGDCAASGIGVPPDDGGMHAVTSDDFSVLDLTDYPPLDIDLPSPNTIIDEDYAGRTFTVGRIYESGGKYYGIFKREESERYNTCGRVAVAEVEFNGNRISQMAWRYVYTTYGGKEYIYGISNNKWKVYTKNVLSGITIEKTENNGKSE